MGKFKCLLYHGITGAPARTVKEYDGKWKNYYDDELLLELGCLFKERIYIHRHPKLPLVEDVKKKGPRPSMVVFKDGEGEVTEKEDNTTPAIDLWLDILHHVRLMFTVYSALRKCVTSTLIGIPDEHTLLEKYLVPVPAGNQEMESSGKDKSRPISFNFNLEYYKATKELRMPSYVKKMLQKTPDRRTPDEISVISQTMMDMPEFRKYSAQMRHSMARIVTYQRLEKLRTIVAKGHVAYSLFFIYSGSVAVILNQRGTKKETVLLNKGQVFGEVGLLKNSRRNSSVQTFEETELLAIDKDEFMGIGLHILQQKDMERRFDYFRGWPPLAGLSDSAIRDLSSHSHTQEYVYNMCALADSRSSDLVWFVIKGKCEVQKFVEVQNRSCGGRTLRKMEKSSHERPTLCKDKPSTARLSTQIDAETKPIQRVCVRVGELSPGDTFGVENIFKKLDKPIMVKSEGQFCLTSKGCSIIYFSSAFIVKMTQHLPVDLDALERTIVRYPDDNEICALLSEQMDWNYFKRYNIEELVVRQTLAPRIANYVEHRDDPGTGKLLEYRPPLDSIGVGPSRITKISNPYMQGLAADDIKRHAAARVAAAAEKQRKRLELMKKCGISQNDLESADLTPT